MKTIISIALTATVFLFTQCKKEDVINERCKLVPDAGDCYAAIPKYYYDMEEKKCKQFIWGGCEGLIPFEILADCEKYCEC